METNHSPPMPLPCQSTPSRATNYFVITRKYRCRVHRRCAVPRASLMAGFSGCDHRLDGLRRHGTESGNRRLL